MFWIIFFGFATYYVTLWFISWFKLMGVFSTFEICGTLFYICKFIFNLSLLCCVPMLCSIVLVVKCYAFSLSTSLLCPLLDFISLMQFPSVVALVKCWTCKWYFGLSLLACMSGCSFLVWMSIVVTIYSNCSFLVKPCFIALFYSAWLHCACSICIISFSTYNDHIVLLFFRRYLFLWFKSYTDSKVRCEWVLFNCSQLTR